MLGEKVGEFRGKNVSQKMLPSEVSSPPRFEVTGEASGTILGIEATLTVTYQGTVRPDGLIYGECQNQGFIMTKDGDMATFTATGLGRFTGQGQATSWRGPIYHQTASQKLARLNEVVIVYEWDIDGDGNIEGSFWEWK